MTVPNRPLRILIVEDRPTDAELLVAELRRAGLGIEATVVDDEASFVAALGSGPDLILADYSMPRFGALAALRIVHERDLDSPLIVVSGTISEEIAVECMHLGAADYLLKDRLGRLGPAVRRAIERRDGERQRQAAEEAVRERDELLRAVFERSTDAIFIADASRRCIDSNPAAVELLGLSRGQIMERRIDDIFASGASDASRDLWADFIARGEQRGELTLLRPDGKARQVDYRAKANFLPGRHLAILRDVTERRTLEDQLRQSQKMEAVGRLAGGIAHDFNNLLTVISGYAQLLGDSLGPADPGREDISAIVSATDLAAALTNQLLAFSRRQILQPRVVDPAEVLSGIAPLIRRIIGEDLGLQIETDPDTGHVRADPHQLEQVILNLAVNARDAMPRGGQLTLEAGNATLDASYAEMHAEVTPGAHVVLSVSDTGMGMDGETRAHIFEPFFTTKDPGHGTGLGLATVYGIVKQSDGHIWVYSEPGRGTTFKVYLPRVDAAVDPLPHPVPAGRPVGGSETILVVEDDDAVRSLVSSTLQRAGYAVLTAEAGPGALETVARETGRIDLLLTDIVMPTMSGRELADRLLASHPELRVLFMSGYTPNAVVHHGVLDPGIAYLAKPFSPDQLLHRVRELLDQPR
jgi:PAS domain S-box-containing protein